MDFFRHVCIWTGVVWSLALLFGGFLFAPHFNVSFKPQDDSVYSNWPSCSINILPNKYAQIINFNHHQYPGTESCLL